MVANFPEFVPFSPAVKTTHFDNTKPNSVNDFVDAGTEVTTPQLVYIS
jgi:hypothetical protein